MLASRYRVWRSRIRRQVATAVMAVATMGMLAGCGSSGGGVHKAPQSVYPDEHYLVAVGSSTESMEDAEHRARQAISAQIRSSLESQVDSRVVSDVSGGKESYSAVVKQTMQQQSAFSHAELIHIDMDSRRERDGSYEVVAYLPRRESGQVLRRDYDAAAEALVRHADAVDAVPRGDLPAFAAAYSEAQESWTELHQRAMELWAVTGRPPSSLAQDQDRWDAVERRRFDFMDGIRVAFSLLEPRPAGDRLDDAYLRQEFNEALTDLGLTLRGDDCESGDYLVELQPRLHYQGVIGVVCRLDFAGSLVECETGDSWNLHLQDERFVGEGSNTYAARKGAEAAVTADTLVPLLAGALDESLPVR